MRKNNSLGGIGFIFEHFIWSAISWVWYKNILFRCLGSHSFAESRLILGSMVVISCIAGVILEMKNSRNKSSVFFNLIVGYGVYTVLTYKSGGHLFL